VSVLPSSLKAASTAMRSWTLVQPASVQRHALQNHTSSRSVPKPKLPVPERMRSVRAIFGHYGREHLAHFLKSGGIHRLQPRTKPLWLAYFDLDLKSCTPKPSVRPNSTYWKG
jgi:hypothetical protein